MSSKRTEVINTLALVFAAFLWGTTFVAQSEGAKIIGPYTFLAGRIRVRVRRSRDAFEHGVLFHADSLDQLQCADGGRNPAGVVADIFHGAACDNFHADI